MVTISSTQEKFTNNKPLLKYMNDYYPDKYIARIILRTKVFGL